MQRLTIPLLRIAAPIAAVLFALTISGFVLWLSGRPPWKRST